MTRETIFKNDKIMVKTTETGTSLYINSIRIEINETLTAEKAKEIAPILIAVFERVYKVAHSNGYQKGFEDGKNNLINQFKNIFNI